MKHRELLQHSHLPKPNWAPIHQLLGDQMPELAPGPRGKHRLALALTQRFGENWRLNSQAQSAVHHFDTETERVRAFFISKGVSHG